MGSLFSSGAAPRFGALPCFGALGPGAPGGAAPGGLPPLAGFSGSRWLPPGGGVLVARVASAAAAAGFALVTGCAPGADEAVRACGVPVRVFRVSPAARSRGAFARRSVEMVSCVLAGPPGSLLAVFPARPCPAGLVPSPSSRVCFRGLGSGSWASAALAAGADLPVVVFPLAGVPLPSWGSWRAVPAGPFAGGFLLAAD